MVLNPLGLKLKRQARGDFKGRHFEAMLIVQAVSWYLRYALSYRDIEGMLLEHGFALDHSIINRWVLAYAPAAPVPQAALRLIARRRDLHQDPRAVALTLPGIDKHGDPVDFLLTANRDLDAAERLLRKMPKGEPLLAPNRIGTDGADPYPPTIAESGEAGMLPRVPTHYVTKHLHQGIESDHFGVNRAMPRVGGFRSLATARRTIKGFEAMLWLRKGFRFAGTCTVRE